MQSAASSLPRSAIIEPTTVAMKPRVSPRRSKSTGYHGMVAAISFLAAVGMMSTIWTRSTAETALQESTTTDNTAGSFDESPMDASNAAQPLERRTMGNNVDALLQRPAEAPKGILFLGHGCSHSHTDWWPSTPEVCPECIGLPEERAIVDMALHDLQFLVVAISSEDRHSKCWSKVDGLRVANVLKELYTAEKATSLYDKIPILAFGASSGGSFVGRHLVESMQALEQPLDGYIAQIAAPRPGSLHELFPVAAYITMNRDTRSDEAAAAIVQDLHQQKFPAKQIRLDPLPLHDSFFRDRIPDYSLDESKSMVDALKAAHYLDPQTNYLSKDPRRSGWRDILRPLVPVHRDSFVADSSPVSEVMNVARGQHEMTRDGVREALEFILRAPADRGSTPRLM